MNLGNATGHPSRVMDGSFANQVLGTNASYSLRNLQILPADQKQAAKIRVEVLPKKLDEEVAAAMVAWLWWCS